MKGTSSKPTFSYTRRVVWIISAFGVVVALLHLVTAFFPSATSWGIHLFAFFPTWVKIIFPLCMILVVIPNVQAVIFTVFQKCIAFITALSISKRRLLIVAVLLFSAVGLWIAREGTTFLGDGFLLVHGEGLQLIKSTNDVPHVFWHEPFTGYIVWSVHRILNALGIIAGIQLSFQIVSIVCGIGFAVLLIVFVHLITENSMERFLTYLCLFSCAGSQLFFGYVENYTPAYAGLLIYIILAFLYLRGRVHLALPSGVFAILFVLYFGMLAFVPTVLMLWYYSIRRRKFADVVFSFTTMLTITVVLLWLCGYTQEAFMRIFAGSESHLVPLFKPQNVQQGYTMFSVKHLIDVTNLYLLLSPFAVLLLAIAAVYSFRALAWKNAEWMFIVLAACCGLAMSVIFHSEIGMSLDWDLLATFGLAVIMAAVFGWILFAPLSVKNQTLFIVAIITLFHTGAYILLNTNEERAIPRFKLLLENSLWARNPSIPYGEIGIYYREKGDVNAAINIYRKFLEYDSVNARILGHLGDLYHLVGDEANEALYYQKAVNYGLKIPEIYISLGIIYAQHAQYEKAITLMEQALDMNPHRPDVVNSVGVFLMQSKKAFDEALPYFHRAIKEDSAYALAYLNAGVCCYHTGRKFEAKFFLSKFLKLQPGYPNAGEITAMIKEIE